MTCQRLYRCTHMLKPANCQKQHSQVTLKCFCNTLCSPPTFTEDLVFYLL